MAQVSVTLKLISKIYMMPKAIKIDRAPNPMELLTIKVPQPVQAGDMVRAIKEGLINLYKEDGTSVTVRA